MASSLDPFRPKKKAEQAEQNILQWAGLRPVASFKSSYGTKEGVPLPKWLVGIELEIEDILGVTEESFRFEGVRFESDGSLRARRGGTSIEGITMPIYIESVEGLLTSFFKQLHITDANYSERCSTHVHFNVQPLTMKQLQTVCLVYQTVERLLFRYVGHDREKSIFCVPWNQTTLTSAVVEKMNANANVMIRWQKYSALNLQPVTTQGTIEFRHLEGTCDVRRISEWIYILAKMFEYALQVPLEQAKFAITQMNTISNYHEWLNTVFGALGGALRGPNFEAELSHGVIDTKLMLSKDYRAAYGTAPDEFDFEGPREDEEDVAPRIAARAAARREGGRLYAETQAQWENGAAIQQAAPQAILNGAQAFNVAWPQAFPVQNDFGRDFVPEDPPIAPAAVAPLFVQPAHAEAAPRWMHDRERAQVPNQVPRGLDEIQAMARVREDREIAARLRTLRGQR